MMELNKLKALAKVAAASTWAFHSVAFQKAANPAAVLEMAELIERLESTLAAERDEHIATHRQLAAEILRADLGWARYEEANADRQALRSHAAQPVAEFEGYEDLGDRSRPLIRLTGAPIKAGTLLYAAAQPAPSAAPIPAQPAAGCSGDTACCPNNEGYGCDCAPQAAAAPDAQPDEQLQRFASWIVINRPEHFKDHACKRCVPHSDILSDGFSCVFHEALDVIGGLHQRAAQPEAKAAPAPATLSAASLMAIAQRLIAEVNASDDEEDVKSLTVRGIGWMHTEVLLAAAGNSQDAKDAAPAPKEPTP